MIGRISGILIEKISSTSICVDVSGLGYEISIPENTNLPEIGKKIVLFTHLAIRQEAYILFGFNEIEKRDVFRLITKVTGIGNKIALSILSNLSLEEFYNGILHRKLEYFTETPGIGQKTAQRLILELHGKFNFSNKTLNEKNHFNKETQNEVESALLSLGYSNKELSEILKEIPKDISSEECIRFALKKLSSLS
ncbi:MAG: Holliday junction branch migration protein RuvA [Bordetella sp.]|nr:MAG: Holliday junction branch migration protein RuvA [Bordetella sp.]